VPGRRFRGLRRIEVTCRTSHGRGSDVDEVDVDVGTTVTGGVVVEVDVMVVVEIEEVDEDRYRDGVCLVELAGLGADARVPEAVLGALRVREPTAGRSASEVLCAALADRDLLLVLDNCEHVVAGVAALVNELLLACAELHLLVTSREPLRVAGEVERPVPPLEGPDPQVPESLERLAAYDAVRLLVERGGDVRPGFRLTDGNAAAVVKICSSSRGFRSPSSWWRRGCAR
jgi:predicted ATPase